MGSVIRKISIIAVIGAIASLVWYFFIPYVRHLNDETLEKRISIATLSNDRNPIEVVIADTKLFVTLLLDEGERLRGLGGRQYIADNEGMLFVYEESGYHAIWMKDMYFSIDIVWIDENFRIIDIAKNVPPSSYPKSFAPDIPARYVLEVNAGYADMHGIQIGDTLSLVGNTNL